MGWEDEERFHQGEDQCRNHHQRNHFHDLAGRSLHRQQGTEGGHGSQDCKDDGYQHLPGAVDRRGQLGFALLMMGVDVFSHYDRVVNDDSQHDDEGKQRDEVDGDVEIRQDQEAAQKGNRDPQADPEGQTDPQEQGQADHHQNQSGQSVLHQQCEAALQDS